MPSSSSKARAGGLPIKEDVHTFAGRALPHEVHRGAAGCLRRAPRMAVSKPIRMAMMGEAMSGVMVACT